MKKSDVVIIISNWLLENAPETYNIQSSYGRSIDAEDLLNLLIEKGMLPPLSLNKQQIYPLESKWYNPDFKGILENIWEPENE